MPFFHQGRGGGGCSNEDGISFVGPLARQIAERPAGSGVGAGTRRGARHPEGLRQGRVDRALFTSDANAYFNDVVLQDFAASLRPFGKLRGRDQDQRATTRRYDSSELSRAVEKKTVLLNIYRMPDGQYEQFLVEEL